MFRHVQTRMIVTVGVLVAMVAGPAFGVSARSKANIPLLRAGSDDDANGRVDFRSRKGKSRFVVRIKDAEANEVHDIVVGGVTRASVTTSGGGNAVADFRSGAISGGQRPLDFDPRGEVVQINSPTETILDTVTDDGSNPPGSRLDERVNLTPTGVQPGLQGTARLRERDGRRDFNVEIEDVADGMYDLLVDGVLRGTIEVAGGIGEIEFASPSDDPDKLPLDFDPLGAVIQVAQGAAVLLSGTLLAPAPGVSVCTPSESTTVLSAVGPDLDASGDARLRVNDDCDRDFRVEAEDLDVGTYELVVGGVVRGTIAVVATADGTEGEIEFDSDPDDLDELPLDFDPTGATVEVRQAGIVYLSGSGGTPGPGTCDMSDVELPLDNSGAVADAKGKARFRQESDCDRDFRVEIQDLPLGAYGLVVGGVPRGSITVELVAGEPVGEIEFDNDPDQPGELLLDFDPRGQLIEVQQGTTLFLSLAFPD